MNQTPPIDKVLEDYKRFLYIVSHDLKAPVRHLEFFTKALFESLEGNVNEDDQEKIGYIKKSMFRLKNMQDALLELSRVVANQEDVGVIQCQGLVEDVIGSLEFENDTEISVEDLPDIQGRLGQIRTVFKNLIQNAIIFNDNDQKIISIFAEQDTEHVKFIVRDNGIGINDEYRHDIFDMFRRLHVESNYGGGTGAGLALAKSIIELHGGEIWVEGNEGGGTDVVFTIPVEN